MFFDVFRKRHGILCSIIVTIFLILAIKLTYLMIIKSEELTVLTDKQYTISEPISNLNFILQDCNGKEMLVYDYKFEFVVDVDSFIKNNRGTDITELNTLIYTLRNYNTEYDLTQLKYNAINRRLYYEIDEETYNKLQKLKDVKGVYCYKKGDVNKSKSWRYENMLINPYDSENKQKNINSLEGIIHEKTKNNEMPKLVFQKDITGKIAEEKYLIPKNNINIRLTSDKELEDLIREVISVDKYKSYGQIGVVLLESESGKIKAMVQRDDWKPNILLCAATENGFEPGSIFKTIVEEAALEKNKKYQNWTVNCTEDKDNHGLVNMEKAYTESCNTYFSNLANEIGFNSIFKMAYKQGLFQKTLNFSGNNEVTGDIVAPKDTDLNKLFQEMNIKPNNIKQANGSTSMIGIGQSMRITPLQALNIVNTVVNGGTYVSPYLIDSLVDDNGIEIEKFNPQSTKVIGKDIANIVKSHMAKVVKSQLGTGKLANIDGIELGGKTGTNTRLNDDVKKSDNYVSRYSDGWFIGYFRNGGKYYSMVVFVKDIDVDKEAAGSTAVPIFKDILNKIVK